jgi:NMD protein affecting ribosome stability and mRNA decay
MEEKEKHYCIKCGKEINGSNMCDDCFNDAFEKDRDSMTGGPDDDPYK